MIFHYCNTGDSVLSIAREYGISPVRLIEENALSDPDRLAVGQCIAIYRSSRTYTVRGGDTFESIGRRFSVAGTELLKWNPGIGEKRILYPGQTLSLGRVEEPFGPLTVNGYVSKHTSISKLRLFASALTYLTITDSSYLFGSGSGTQKEKDLIDFCAQNDIVPLLMSRPSGSPKSFCETLSSIGYKGAVIDCGGRDDALPYLYALKEADMVALAVNPQVEDETAHDWVCVLFGDHRTAIEQRFSDIIKTTDAPYRLMIELPYCGIELSLDDAKCIRTLPIVDCPHLAYRKNAQIVKRADGKVGFSFGVTVFGKHERHEVIFDDLATIEKGLSILGELGVCGISIYPEWSPRGLPTLLHHRFDVIKSRGEKIGGRFSR